MKSSSTVLLWKSARALVAAALGAAVLPLLCGCAHHAAPAPPPLAEPPSASALLKGAPSQGVPSNSVAGALPATIHDWDDGALQSVEFDAPVDLRSYPRVIVEPFDDSAVELPPGSASDYTDLIGTLRDARGLFIGGMKSVWHSPAAIVPDSMVVLNRWQQPATAPATLPATLPAIAPPMQMPGAAAPPYGVARHGHHAPRLGASAESSAAASPMPSTSPTTSGVTEPLSPTTIPTISSLADSASGSPAAAARRSPALVLRITISQLDAGPRGQNALNIRASGDTRLVLHGELLSAASGAILLRFDSVSSRSYGHLSNPYRELLRAQLKRAGQAAGLLLQSLDQKSKLQWSARPDKYHYCAVCAPDLSAPINLTISR